VDKPRAASTCRGDRLEPPEKQKPLGERLCIPAEGREYLVVGNAEPPALRRFSQALLACTGEVRPKRPPPARVALQPQEALLPAIILSVDPVTGTVGKRPSGARLYHRGSRFGPPERRGLDRNLVAKLLFLAEALDRRTRAKRQHGGLLKGKGLDVLRALLRGFYSYRTGECFPSWDAIAEAAGCCRETVRKKLRVLEQLGIIETVRRKIVASFVNREHRIRFNFAVADRRQHGDLALPLLKPEGFLAKAKFRPETNSEVKTTLPPDIATALAGLGNLISAADRTV